MYDLFPRAEGGKPVEPLPLTIARLQTQKSTDKTVHHIVAAH